MKKEIIKPFDLEKAKAGAKLRTKGGCAVEIFKWDAKGGYPIKGIVIGKTNDKSASWKLNGSWCGRPYSFDLVIVEEAEEPKFKVNDWITNGEYIYKIVEITDTCYKCNSNEGSTYLKAIDDVDENYYLWTLDYAESGDVLVVENIIFIYKYTLASHIVSCCKLINSVFEPYGDERTCCEGNKYVHPATKKQHDLLFQKMKEAGYEWNAGMLELKKIKPEFWSDNGGSDIVGFYISVNSHISDLVNVTNSAANYNVFATKKQAKSALAMARISQIMANDIENFGGVITDEEWENDEQKYVIYRYGSHIRMASTMVNGYKFLAFHTEKQRNLFFEKYPQLVKDYLMISDEKD